MNAAGTLLGLLGGANPFFLILGRLLDPKTDWKHVLLTEGAAEANRRLETAWQQKVTPPDVARIAAVMAAEGWSWAAAQDPAFLKAQKVQISDAERTLGPGFIISRDVIYSILRETGVPGGAVRDGWRDTLDNPVWAELAGSVTETTPLPELAGLTFAAMVRVVL